MMGISEATLFTTLAQLTKKKEREVAPEKEPGTLEVLRPDPVEPQLDPQYVLERKIIELLLLYGKEREQFEDWILKENESGELDLVPEQTEAFVFEKIFLDLQEDEIELSHDQFRLIYYHLIQKLNSNPNFTVQELLSEFDTATMQEISSILMDEERYTLHQWERREIYPREKRQGLSQEVSETILSLRRFLIQRRIDQLRTNTEQNVAETHIAELEEIMNYLQLNKLLNKKLNRVIS
jgi:DNA primase